MNNHTQKENIEINRHNYYNTTTNADKETTTTLGFQQASTTTKPPDQIKEILTMIQVMMKEIQELKQNSLNKETKESSKQQ